jgi:hypothetical protein
MRTTIDGECVLLFPYFSLQESSPYFIDRNISSDLPYAAGGREMFKAVLAIAIGILAISATSHAYNQWNVNGTSCVMR